MKRIFPIALTFALGLFSASVQASFHNFRIDQVFSNADGTIQYVVMREIFNTDGEGFWTGQKLETESLGGITDRVGGGTLADPEPQRDGGRVDELPLSDGLEGSLRSPCSAPALDADEPCGS